MVGEFYLGTFVVQIEEILCASGNNEGKFNKRKV